MISDENQIADDVKNCAELTFVQFQSRAARIFFQELVADRVAMRFIK